MPEYTSALYCDHANEMPARCPCPSNCYCKAHSCRSPDRWAVHPPQREEPLPLQTQADAFRVLSGPFPHCDHRVLHRPGACEYCDTHPDWQALRIIWNINFTGESDGGKMPCPAERDRSADRIHQWGGNRPTNGIQRVEARTRYERELNDAFEERDDIDEPQRPETD